MKKKVLWALSLVLLLCLFVLGAGAEKKTIVAEGTCGAQGDNLTWALDSEGTLTISGQGEMKNYWNYYYGTPWKSYAGDIKNLIIEEGVTGIGGAAFSGCSALTSVTLPENITSIGTEAFSYATRCNVRIGTDTAKTLSKAGYNFWVGDLAYRYEYDEDNLTGLSVVDCDPQVTSVVVPEGVTSIGGSAFEDCSALTSVSIPAGVASIGYYAFSGCSALTSVSIPEGVTSIGNDAFYGCSVLTNVSIPEGVTSIGEWTFAHCSALINVSIPSSVVSIGKAAFYDCSALTSVTLPENITYIGSNVFPDKVRCNVRLGTDTAKALSKSGENFWIGDLACRYMYDKDNLTGLQVVDCDPQATSVVVPEGVTNIGDSAFSGCSALTSVSIPVGVTSIGNYAFNGCSALTSVSIPKGVTSIGDSAFYGCSVLASVSIPEGVTSIGDWTFGNCSALTSVSIPEGVTSIDRCAFYNCSSLTAMKLPEGLMYLGESTFQNCYSLDNMNFPDSLVSIGIDALPNNLKCYAAYGTSKAEMILKSGHNFWDGNLAYQYERDGNKITELLCVVDCDPQAISVVVPEGVTNIGDHAFSGCSALTSVSIPAGVTSIGDSAFYGCSALTSVSIPAGVTSIGDYAFCGCSALTSVSIPVGVTSIADGAFSKCSQLKHVQLPEGLVSIGIGAFSGCSALTSLTLPESLTSINHDAFRECSELSYINLPESVTKIGEQAFLGCKKLRDIVLPSGLTVLERGVFYGTGITNIVIPDGVTEIGQSLFYYGVVKNVVLPNSVTIIDDHAFYACGMKTLVIPENVTTIGKEAIASVKVICYAKEGLTNFSSSSFQWKPETVYCWEFSPMESYANEAGCNVVLLDDLLDENGNIDWSKDTNDKTLTVQETCDMRVGTQRALDWNIFPGTNAAAEMTSSAPETVSIENGVLTAHKPGSATITVTVDGLTASCEVTAYEQVTELAFADAALSLPAKYTAALPLTCAPEGSNETLLWSSSNENVATVADGVITTKALGTTDITVMAKHSGLSAACTVTVTYPVTAVQFAAAEAKAVVGDKVQLTANVTARTQKYANELVTFTSSAPETAQVDRHGVVTLLAPGTATITATAMGNEALTATCTVTAVAAETAQVKLPANLTAVEAEVLTNTAAEFVVIPEGCESIGSLAFSASKVGRVEIPASVTSIADDAFAGCAVTISAPEDSFAMSWAKEHGVPYIVK